ncbi:MAG: matrixin family metalloprotease [Minisyncoccia bacterium]
MSFVRKYILWVILLASFGYAYFGHVPQPCDKPIEYSLGVFDERFGVSKTDFLASLKSAENYWEKAVGRNLFEYNTQGKLVVNLVYDDRQATTQKNKVLESNANQNKESADTIKVELDKLEAQYEVDKNSYTNLLNAYKTLEAKYNSEVSFYNARGGAPKTEYTRIIQEKQSLDEQGAQLEAKRIALNSLGDDINVLVQKHNAFVAIANTNINTLNQSAGKEFNEGEYITDQSGERINIYEFTSKTKLVRILEHELGHALGLEHGQDPNAIMYYLNQGENLTPTKEDKTAVEKACAVSKTYLQQAFDMIQSVQIR